MRYLNIFLVLCLSVALLSCGDDDKMRRAETLRTAKQNDSILKILNNNWKFDVPALSPNVESRIAGWNEWQQFREEMAQKPAGSLRGYRQKTKALALKAEQLRNTLPSFFNKPQVISRIGVMITKIKSLYTYISLDVIPDKKVTALINEVAHETASFQFQLDELVRISEIPKEIGEEEMLRALDTKRMADPDAAQQPESEDKTEAARPTTLRPLPTVNGIPIRKVNKKKVLKN